MRQIFHLRRSVKIFISSDISSEVRVPPLIDERLIRNLFYPSEVPLIQLTAEKIHF